MEATWLFVVTSAYQDTDCESPKQLSFPSQMLFTQTFVSHSNYASNTKKCMHKFPFLQQAPMPITYLHRKSTTHMIACWSASGAEPT